MNSDLSAKRAKIQRELSTEKKRDCIKQMRKALIEARQTQRKQEQEQLEHKLISMFRDKDEYEFYMKLIDDYEKDEAEYQAYLHAMEQESMSYQNLQRQQELKRKGQLIQKILTDDQ